MEEKYTQNYSQKLYLIILNVLKGYRVSM